MKKLTLIIPLIVVGFFISTGQAHATYSFTDNTSSVNVGWFNAPYGNRLNVGDLDGEITSIQWYVGGDSSNQYRVNIYDWTTASYLMTNQTCDTPPSSTGILNCDLSTLGIEADSTHEYEVNLSQGPGGAFNSVDIYGGNAVGGRTCTIAGDPGGYCSGGKFLYMVVNTTSAIIPPRSDVNEVVRYWPGNNYATSTGETTVGVQFSIAHPEWIEAVGFDISGTNDTSGSTTVAYTNVLYTATTTVSTAQTFSLTTDYDFTEGGYYTINAFFVQDGRKIYNNTFATILIDYIPPNITVGANGQFQFNGTTTVSTSTLDALRIDCGDIILVSSMCKILVSFVIPDPSAIQGVRESWNALLTKAPFSFFIESKSVLGAFASTTTSTGGTLSLNFYGQEAPIISTSTASSIGLGTTPINALKFLITIGLWIMMAWFLYWRIGGILARIERV